MEPESINTQCLKKCLTPTYNYTSSYSESDWNQLFDEDILVSEKFSGMKLDCSFRVLKCPLNLKLYDSDETISLPENKIRTWLRSKQSLVSTAPAREGCRTPQDHTACASSPRLTNSLQPRQRW